MLLAEWMVRLKIFLNYRNAVLVATVLNRVSWNFSSHSVHAERVTHENLEA